eukprot:GFUD01015556.1.p1 GENE.GFUD01015556.1~~GFUD01015556.1.p1  ORF type:complete len:295 (-),score=85.11 GFUD01015556.1:208-1092(-)
MVDYYSILGIAKAASKDDVKKAYKKLAKKWHPDKNPNNQDEATRKFKEVSEAYQVLSDDSKRRTYDREGKDGLNPGESKRSSNRGPDYNFNFPRPDDFNYPDTDNVKKQQQDFSDLGSRRSKFRNNRRNTEPAFSGSTFNHPSFMFKDPEEVFKDFFGGSDPFKDFMNNDPFKDFLDPFGSGGGLGISRFPDRHQSERSIPVHLGFSTNLGFDFPHSSAMHGFAGRKSIFDELDQIEAMFGGLGLGGHNNRFHQQAHRPTNRSHSSHPTSNSRPKPQSSSHHTQQAQGHRRKRY